MNEENQVYFVDSDKLPPAALERKHRLEQDPSFRTDHMKYMDGMQVIESDIKDKVLKAMDEYDYDLYTANDVERALSHETCTIEDFKALLSPAAAPYLEQMARKAEELTKNHFGNTVYIFTPTLYCQLLSELLHLLRLQLLQQHPQKETDLSKKSSMRCRSLQRQEWKKYLSLPVRAGHIQMFLILERRLRSHGNISKI